MESRPRRTATHSVVESPSTSPMGVGAIQIEASSVSNLVRVLNEIGKHIDLSVIQGYADPTRVQEARGAARAAVETLASTGKLSGEVQATIDAAVAEVCGLGAIDILLQDQTITELIVEGPNRILVAQGNDLTQIGGGFSSTETLQIIAKRLLAQAEPFAVGPIHNTRLPGGAFLTVVLPPVALGGPYIEVRRQGSGVEPQQLVEEGLVSAEIASTLEIALQREKNIVFTGEPHSSVTRLLGAFADSGGLAQRIVTLESSPRLSLKSERVISLIANGNDAEFESVLRQALHMRAHRMVIDGVRGAEVLHMLTGLASLDVSCLVGVHTSTGSDSWTTLSTLAQLGRALPTDSLERLMGRSIDLLVSVVSTPQGSRISRVVEVIARGSEVEIIELFVYEGGVFRSTNRPSFT
ncbi:MAG: ATPase, T2SS/T4P/T4SS family [Myxococcota bacterium]